MQQNKQATAKSALPASVTARPADADMAKLEQLREIAVADKPSPATAEAIKASAEIKKSSKRVVETHAMLKELGITAYYVSVAENKVVVKTYAAYTKVQELFPETKIAENRQQGGWTFVVDTDRATQLINAPKPAKKSGGTKGTSIKFEMHAESAAGVTTYVAIEPGKVAYNFDRENGTATVTYTNILLHAIYDSVGKSGTVTLKGKTYTMYVKTNMQVHPEQYDTHAKPVMKDGQPVTKIDALRPVFIVEMNLVSGDGSKNVEQVATYSAVNTLEAMIVRSGRIAD